MFLVYKILIQYISKIFEKCKKFDLAQFPSSQNNLVNKPALLSVNDITVIHFFIKTIMIDKKLIAAFRAFVERIFLPTLKKTDPAVAQWNKFNQLLSIDTNNYEEVAQYIDSIGVQNTQPTFAPLEKREMPLFKKRAETDNINNNNNDAGGFNPSKTFGGERMRMMFMKGELDDYGEQKQGAFGGLNSGRSIEDNKRNQAAINPQLILPGLERLCKTFLQNQGRIDNILNGIKPMGAVKYT